MTIPTDDIRLAILRVLPYSGRVTPSHIHQALKGQFGLMAIEAELIVMDSEGLIANHQVPMSSITEKGRKARGAANA